MFDTIETYNNPLSTSRELRAYVDEHRNALLDAAALLGGAPGVMLAQCVIDGLGDAKMPSRRTMKALDELLDLLTLEYVHDPNRIEATQFAMIDPASSCVEEICLLADQLSDLIDGYLQAEAGVGERAAGRVAA